MDVPAPHSMAEPRRPSVEQTREDGIPRNQSAGNTQQTTSGSRHAGEPKTPESRQQPRPQSLWVSVVAAITCNCCGGPAEISPSQDTNGKVVSPKDTTTSPHQSSGKPSSASQSTDRPASGGSTQSASSGASGRQRRARIWPEDNKKGSSASGLGAGKKGDQHRRSSVDCGSSTSSGSSDDEDAGDADDESEEMGVHVAPSPATTEVEAVDTTQADVEPDTDATFDVSEGADSYFQRRDGLRGLRLIPDKSESSDSDEDNAEVADDTWLEPEVDDNDKAPLAAREVNDFFERESAIQGLKLKPESMHSSSSEGSEAEDLDAEDWLEEDESEPVRLGDTEEFARMSSKELFEEKFQEFDGAWANLATLKVVFDKSGLGPTQQQQFLTALQRQEFSEGDYIVRQGDKGDRFYIVTEGEVAVTIGNTEGTETVVTHLYTGHFFGETSLVKEEPRNANVKVCTPHAIMMSIGIDVFKPFLEQEEGFRRFIDELVAKKEETTKRRQAVARSFDDEEDDCETEKRNEVKVSVVRRRARTKSFKTVINNYVFLNKLGQGAFGQVFLAKAVTDGKLFAVKHIDRANLRKKGFSAKSDKEILREITVMKRLQHKNVVTLYEVIDDPVLDRFYMVTEYMELGPIMTDEEYNKPMQPDVVRKYLRDVLLGLEYLHFQGVVHRDIKPGNLLVATDGVCKIADFGTSVLTTDGVIDGRDVRGTPAFMAPELFNEDISSYNGFPVDIWALGATIFTAIVGIPPFMAENEIKLAEKVQTQELRFPVDLQLDPHLMNMLRRMLTKDPVARISLQELMWHEWVTREGSDPLLSMEHKRLRLAETSVDQAACESLKIGRTLTMVDPLDMDTIETTSYSPAPLPARRVLDRRPSTDTYNTRRRTSICSSDLTELKRRGMADNGARPVASPRLSTGSVSTHGIPPRFPGFFNSPEPTQNPRASFRWRRHLKATSSFHNREASKVTSERSNVSRSNVKDETVDHSKEHLRALRARQYKLLSSHHVDADIKDTLLEQQRLPFHSDRASLHVEEFFMDKDGAISSMPNTSRRPRSRTRNSPLLTASTRASAGANSRIWDGKSSGSMSSVRASGRLVSPKTPMGSAVSESNSRQSLLSLPEDSPLESYDDLSTPDHRDSAETQSLASGSAANLRVRALSGLSDSPNGSPGDWEPSGMKVTRVSDDYDPDSDDDTPAPVPRLRAMSQETVERHTSLRRLNDFVMVTSNVESMEDGVVYQKKVIFQAKGKDGSLSITGGRGQIGKPSRIGTKSSLKSYRMKTRRGSAESDGVSAAIPEEGDEPLDSSRLDQPKSKKMTSGSLTSNASEEEEEEEEEESTESSSDSDDDFDDGDITVLDDMNGTLLADELGDVLDGLAPEAAVASEDMNDFTTEEEEEWEKLRASKLFAPAFGNPMGLIVGTAEQMGRRVNMEDRIAVYPDLNAYMGLPLHFRDHAFFAVYDGHEGDATSQSLSESLHAYVCRSGEFVRDPVGALVEGCLACDDAIIEEFGDRTASGSTAIVLLIRKARDSDDHVMPKQGSRSSLSASGSLGISADGAETSPKHEGEDSEAIVVGSDPSASPNEDKTMLYCANVGDSKAVLCRGGKAVELSYDHKPTRKDELARITAAGGTVVRNRLYGTLGVSRAFGDVKFKLSPDGSESNALIAEPEVMHEELLPQDEFAVLACDGVWDVMTPQQVVNFVRRRLLTHHDPQEAAEELVQKAIDLNSVDNVSAIVVRFPGTSGKD